MNEIGRSSNDWPSFNFFFSHFGGPFQKIFFFIFLILFYFFFSIAQIHLSVKKKTKIKKKNIIYKMYFQRLFPTSPVKSQNSPPSNHSTAPTSALTTNQISMSSCSAPSLGGGTSTYETHVDVDSLIEEYVWQRFKDLLSIKGSGLESFKNLEFADAEFDIVSFC
jgi:hypothetical protein